MDTRKVHGTHLTSPCPVGPWTTRERPRYDRTRGRLVEYPCTHPRVRPFLLPSGPLYQTDRDGSGSHDRPLSDPRSRRGLLPWSQRSRDVRPAPPTGPVKKKTDGPPSFRGPNVESPVQTRSEKPLVPTSPVHTETGETPV